MKMNTPLLIGLVLLMISGYPLFLHGRELIISNIAHSQYELNPIYNSNWTEFYGNTIVLTDKFIEPSEEYKIGPVTITINGRDYSHPSEVEVRPMFHDSNRYHNYLNLVEIVDKEQSSSKMAIIQRISGYYEKPIFEKQFVWRLLLVNRDGHVEEEVFKYGEQSKPVYRGMLIPFASPIGIGYYSNVMHAYPSLFYPIVYPYGIGLIGFILLLIGTFKLVFRQRDSRAS